MTNGHPNCLRIALILFVLTFALCIYAVSAQELGVRDGGPLAPPLAVHVGETDPRASQPRPSTGTRSGSKAVVVTTPDLEQDGKARQGPPPSVAAGTRPVSKVFALTTATYLGLSWADFYLSNRCIQSGQCVEIGSYRGIASHPLAFGLVKMGASSALAATAWQMRKTHPRAGWAMLAGLTVAQAGVDLWNLKQGVRR